MSLKFIYIIMAILGLNACAWKASETGNPSHHQREKLQLSEEGNETKNAAPKQVNVSIHWQGSTQEGRVLHLKRTISEKPDMPKEFYVDRPITLSATVPNEVELDFDVSGLHLKLEDPILISGKVDSSDLSLKDNPLSLNPDHALIESTNDESHLKVRIDGVRNILPDNEQVKAYISLDLRVAKTMLKVASVYFSLTTPPKRVFFLQTNLADSSPTNQSIATQGWDVLQSPSQKLELIQYISSSNETGEDIEVEMPVMLTGKLWQKRRFFFPQSRLTHDGFVDRDLCLDVSEEVNRDFVFTEKFYVLPLHSELTTNWISMVTENIGRLIIPAGKVKLFGIFAENLNAHTWLKTQLKESRLDEYYTHKYHRQPQMKSINVQCEFGCNQANFYNRFFTQCGEISADHPDWIAQCKERVTACEPCVNLRGPSDYGTVWSASCNQCHTLETLEGFNRIFDYHGMKACDSWQRKVIRTKQVPEGEVVDPVILDLNSEAIKAKVRFNFSDRDQDPEGRIFETVKKSVTFE